MENSSDLVLDSGERGCFSSIGTNGDGLLDDEFFTSIDFSVSEDDLYMGQVLDMPSDVTEPYQGMTFGSKEEARDFYVIYGKQAGFTIRNRRNYQSRKDRMVIGQDFVCSKEGFHKKKQAEKEVRYRCPPPVTREGCPAMLRVHVKDGGRWAVTKFVKEHSHSLMPPSDVPLRVPVMKSVSEVDKDHKIKELTMELYNERQQNKRRCAAYQEQLETLLKYIEDHTDQLTRSVKAMVERVEDIDKIA